MRLTHRQRLDAPVDDVWAAFLDLERIGRCFPGAAVTEVDGDDFVGHVKARIGPLTMTFDGTGAVVERAEGERRARLRATGRERHGIGRATIDVTLHLAEDGPGDAATRTHAALTTELTVHGIPTTFGTGIVQRVSDPLVERFLSCMAGEEGACDVDDSPLDVVRSGLDVLGSLRPRARRGR